MIVHLRHASSPVSGLPSGVGGGSSCRPYDQEGGGKKKGRKGKLFFFNQPLLHHPRSSSGTARGEVPYIHCASLGEREVSLRPRS